jgi:hypothetical protein
MKMTTKTKNKEITIEAAVAADYTISYWYESNMEMPECEQEHVKEMVEEGYTSGQLVYEYKNGNINTGWWSIIGEPVKVGKYDIE